MRPTNKPVWLDFERTCNLPQKVGRNKVGKIYLASTCMLTHIRGYHHTSHHTDNHTHTYIHTY